MEDVSITKTISFSNEFQGCLEKYKFPNDKQYIF